MAFLVLFAVRVIACTSLCELSGRHGVPSSALPATAGHALALPGAHDALKIQQASPGEQPVHDEGDQVCEEEAYVPTQSVSLSAIKGSPSVDAIAWSNAPARDWTLAAVATKAFLPRLAHPPPPRSPLDISPRLRI